MLPGRQLLTWALLMIGVAGCAGGTNQQPIKGEVTFDGAPVGPGNIEFHPEPGTESRRAAAPIENGKYEVPQDRGPLPGFFKVKIHWSKRTGKQIPSADPGMTTEEVIELVPEKYNSQSTLIVEIKPGENVHHFHLKKE